LIEVSIGAWIKVVRGRRVHADHEADMYATVLTPSTLAKKISLTAMRPKSRSSKS
jgi:hypothetical protein